MELEILDISIIALYLLTTLIIGLVLKNRAQKNKSAYLCGGNTLPWYMPGFSNASGMFDISGTMWIVALAFAYGFIGLGKFIEIFIPWEVISPHLPFSLPETYVPHFYGIILTTFAVFYSVLGGMKSIVWADLVQ